MRLRRAMQGATILLQGINKFIASASDLISRSHPIACRLWLVTTASAKYCAVVHSHTVESDLYDSESPIIGYAKGFCKVQPSTFNDSSRKIKALTRGRTDHFNTKFSQHSSVAV